jgi:hypothetical protein
MAMIMSAGSLSASHRTGVRPKKPINIAGGELSSLSRSFLRSPAVAYGHLPSSCPAQ